MACPNTSTKEWKLLEDALGYEGAMAVFIAKGEDLPSVEEGKALLGSINKAYEDTQRDLVGPEVERIAKELNDPAKIEKLNRFIDAHYDKIGAHLRALIKDNREADLKRLLTPTGSDKPSLASTKTLLKQAQDSVEDVPRIKAQLKVVLGQIVQGSVHVKLMNEALDEYAKTPEEDHLAESQSFLRFTRTLETTVDQANEIFGDYSPNIKEEIKNLSLGIKDLKAKILSHDTRGVIKELGSILEPALEEMRSKLQSMIDAQEKNLANATRAGKSIWKRETQASLAQHREDLRLVETTLKDGGVALLSGEFGDASMSFLFESFRHSADLLVSTIAQWFKEGTDKARAAWLPGAVKTLNSLAPIIDKLGNSYRVNRDKIRGAITFDEELLDKEGKLYKITRYLSLKPGFAVDGAEKYLTGLYQDLENLKDSLAQEVDPTKKEELQTKIQDAVAKLETAETKYQVREATPEYYQDQKALWDDAIGRALRETVTEIWDQIRYIDDVGKNQGGVSSEELEFKASLIRQYQNLSNVNNPDGSSKTGDMLELAKRMQQIKEFNKTHRKWVFNEKFVNQAKEEQSNYLIQDKGLEKDSPEYASKMQVWEDSQQRQEKTDAFYEDQEEIYKIIDSLSDKSLDLTKENETITGLIQGHKDENNDPIGIEIPEKGAERILEASKAIEKAKADFIKASHLSPEEVSERSVLLKKERDRTISDSELVRLRELNTIVASGKSKLTPAEAKELEKAWASLNEIRSFKPTEYYIDAYNTLAAKHFLPSLDEDGMVFNVDDNALEPILSSKRHLAEFLEYDDCNNWFHLNHFEVENWDAGSKRTQKSWRATRQWTRIVPNDEKYYHKVWARKYFTSEIADDYATGFNPETGKVELKVGEHIDNKGRFLFKEGDDGRFKNQKAYDLMADTSAQGELHRQLAKTIIDDHLDMQEGAQEAHKLWMDVPRQYKTTLERVKAFLDPKTISNLPSKTVNSLKALWRSELSYTQGEGNYEDEKLKEAEGVQGTVNSEAVQGRIDSTIAPIAYTGKIDSSEITGDIVNSHLGYKYALRLANQIGQMTPKADAILNILQTENENYINLKAKYNEIKTGAGKPKGPHTNRIKAIARLYNRDILGQNLNFDTAGSKSAAVILRYATTLTGTVLLKLNPLITVGNAVKWTTENFVEAGSGTFNHTDWAVGIAKTCEWELAMAGDYTRNKINEVPWQLQLDIAMGSKQGESLEHLLQNRLTRSKTLDFFKLKWILNHREWIDYFTQTSLRLAMMNAIKLEQKQEDGSIRILPYHEAWETDQEGILKLKDGISKTWAPGGKDFERFVLKYNTVNVDVNGALDRMDKSYLQQYVSYNAAMFLKSWLIGTYINHWAFSDFRVNKTRLAAAAIAGILPAAAIAEINPFLGLQAIAFTSIFASGAFHFSPRKSLGRGLHFGRFPAFLDAQAQQVDAGFNKVEFSDVQKGFSKAGGKVLLGSLFFTALAIIAAGTGTAITGFARKWDEDDDIGMKEREAELKSLGYWRTLMLYESLRVANQTSTFFSVDQSWSNVTDQAVILQTAKDFMLLIIYGLSQTSETHRNEYHQKVTTKKYLKPLEQLTGFHSLEMATPLSLTSKAGLDQAILHYEKLRAVR